MHPIANGLNYELTASILLVVSARVCTGLSVVRVCVCGSSPVSVWVTRGVLSHPLTPEMARRLSSSNPGVQVITKTITKNQFSLPKDQF